MFGDFTGGQKSQPPREDKARKSDAVAESSDARLPKREHTRGRWWWWVAGGAVAIIVLGVVVFLRVGNWLVVQDPLEQSGVIVVLSGQMPERAREAAGIFQQKFAPEVWITRSDDDPTEELRQLGIAYVGEAFYDEKILMQLGVPPESIRVMDQASSNTKDEINKIGALARSEGLHRVIVVTSKAHTRRVRLIWRKLLGRDPALIVRYASSDPYDGSHWWRHTQDSLDVLRETMGLLNAWAGFPLQHRVTSSQPAAQGTY
jgi:uncharacterized SAM-binding protein YcdF (DUF218 family)